MRKSISRKLITCLFAVIAFMITFSFAGIRTESLAYEGSVLTSQGDQGADDNREERKIGITLYTKNCYTQKITQKYSGMMSDGGSFSTSLNMADQCRIEVSAESDSGTVFPGGDDIEYSASWPDMTGADDEGNIVFVKPGKSSITVLVRGDEKYRDCSVTIVITSVRTSAFRYNGQYCADWGSDNGDSITVNKGSDPRQIKAYVKPGAGVSFSSRDPKVASVDKDGLVTPLSEGSTVIYVDSDEGDRGQYAPDRKSCYITVSGTDQKKDRYVWMRQYTSCCWETGQERTNEFVPVTDGGSHTMNMALCDGYRLDVFSVIGSQMSKDDVLLGKNDIAFSSSAPDVLEVDKSGRFTLHKAGNATVTVFVKGDSEYKDCSVSLIVRVFREGGFYESKGYSCDWGSGNGDSITVKATDDPLRMGVHLKPGARVTFTSGDPQIADVDENGIVTPKSEGTTLIYATCDEGDSGQFKSKQEHCEITVIGYDNRSDQTINGITGTVTVAKGKTVKLGLKAKTSLEYASDNKSIATVSAGGTVRGVKAGSTTIRVKAVSSSDYRSAEAKVRITVRDYEAEKAAKAKEAKREAIRRARSLKAPVLKCSVGSRKVKISWNKVTYAGGYLLYVKYPSSKKYVKVLKKNARVKSVTHKGLARGKRYSYKMRAYAVVDGKYYYGPMSKAKTVKVK